MCLCSARALLCSRVDVLCHAETGLHSAPEGGRAFFAEVAREVAHGRVVVAEVAAYDPVPTLARRLAVADRRLERFLLAARLRLPRRRREPGPFRPLVSELALHVGLDEAADSVALLARVENDAGGGFAVAAAAAGFLDEGFQAAGQTEVDDEADVGGVDAHAKGGGGDDDVEGVG